MMTPDEKGALMADLPPFTITITNPDEAGMLISGLIMNACGCVPKAAQQCAAMLNDLTEQFGPVQGVELWHSTGLEGGAQLPVFLKPLLIHVFSHLEKKMKAL